jgi:hypothetical protein
MHPGRQRILTGACAAILVAALLASPASAQSTPDDPSERRRQALERIVDTPFPKPDCPTRPEPGNRCVWGKLNLVLATLSLTGLDDAVQRANATLAGALADLAFQSTRMGQSDGFREGFDFHFLTSGLLARIYFSFQAGSGKTAGRLSDDNARAIGSAFWTYAQRHCRLAEADPAQPWRLWGTENHDIMRATTCLAAAEILSQRPVCGACTYGDRSTPQSQRLRWTDRLKEYVRQRVSHGGFVEFFSPTYYRYTLQNFYNLSEYASDAELRRLSHDLLDVWWMSWAQEQAYGIHGGSKARIPNRRYNQNFPGSELAWFYFGLGDWPRTVQAAGLVIAYTSAYRPNGLISDVATDIAGRGSYEVQTRAVGLLMDRVRHQTVPLDAAAGGIVRYAFVTPSYIMSSIMMAKHPVDAWAAISAQSRWAGVTLPQTRQRLTVEPYTANPNVKFYNPVWMAQSRGTQIVQKLAPPFGRSAGPMAVILDHATPFTREEDWILMAAGDAYIAFRPARGTIADPIDGGKVFVLSDERAPVIVQLAEKRDFSSLADFKAAVLRAPLHVDAQSVRFSGLHQARSIEFYHSSDRLPEIGGAPVDVAPPFAFKSPFLNGAWGDGRVEMKVGNRTIRYDVR